MYGRKGVFIMNATRVDPLLLQIVGGTVRNAVDGSQRAGNSQALPGPNEPGFAGSPSA